MTLLDDLGHPVDARRPAQRVVSLVPSITEALAATRPEALVGATDWCTHPGDLDVVRVRGTKNPDRAAVEALAPDLVVANQEENRELDVQRLRAAGVPVWVTRIETVDEAFASLDRLFAEALGWGVPAWLADAAQAWGAPVPDPRGTVVVPIWRDPWMVVGPATFTSDLLRRLGWTTSVGRAADGPGGGAGPRAANGPGGGAGPRAANGPGGGAGPRAANGPGGGAGPRAADNTARYPHVELTDIDTADVDLVLLPDEPYVFGPDDGPEAFTSAPTRLVSGRHLTWYGPSLLEARSALDDLASP